MPPKHANPYSLFNKPLQSTDAYDIYDARDNKTNQIWLAKVIKNEFVLENELTEHLGFNEEVFMNLKNKKNVIYVNEIFSKNDKTFFIQEKYSIRLSDYLQREEKLNEKEVEQIIRNVFEGVCDIYEEEYFIKNIRPEHIVKVEDEWKLQTLVFDNKQFSFECPYTWNKKYSSPEEKVNKDLDGDEQDAQLVWQFAHLALTLLNGKKFIYRKIVRDADVRLQDLKNITESTPNLYEMIQKCYKINIKDRISLKQFFNLPIFKNLLRQNIQQHFFTASKIFKSKKNEKSSINKGFSGSNIFRTMSYMSIKINTSKKQDLINKFFIKLERCRFISRFIYNLFDNLNIKEEDKLIAQYQILKFKQILIFQLRSQLFDKNVEQFKKLNEGQKIQKLFVQQETISKKQMQGKYNKIKTIRSTQTKLLQKNKIFLADISESISKELLIRHLGVICGMLYSQLKQECDQQFEEEKQKKIASLIYFMYLAIHQVDVIAKDFGNKIQKKADERFNFTQFLDRSRIQDLTAHSQEILSKYFSTSSK